MNIAGAIKDYDKELGVLYIVAPLSEHEAYILNRRKIKTCEVRLDDGRAISSKQREAIFATLRDIAEWSGHEPQELKELFKYDFIAVGGSEQYFSLSNTDMTTARGFLTHLIVFCVINGVPCNGQLLDRVEEIDKYIYACVINRKCAVCGEMADIHEYDAVGVGRNRKKIHHDGVRVIPLCPLHHIEAERIGRDTFCSKHHLTWITLDPYACAQIGWQK